MTSKLTTVLRVVTLIAACVVVIYQMKVISWQRDVIHCMTVYIAEHRMIEPCR